MRIRLLTFLLLGCVIAIAGCSRKMQESKTPESEVLKPESAHAPDNPAAAASNEGLKFTAPSGWIAESPASSSRRAQYRLTRAKGDSEDAELVIYYFGGGGGTIQANVDRWIGQFAKPDGTPASDTAKVTHKNINGISVTIVDVSGIYAGSMMAMQQSAKPKTHYRMLGAIAETGNGPWFVKLTGPANTVGKWQSSFQSFIESMHQGN